MSNTASFITGIDTGAHGLREQNHLLDAVRKENIKVREVVNSFSTKVEVLVDKQRNEYMVAYENHMQDVQRELHSLRGKVADIANDETKADKTAKLKEDQIRFKNEALKLEADSDEIRKRLRELAKETYTAEKSRDWLLKKLRQAKKMNTELLKEKDWLAETYDCSSALSQMSIGNASSYTLELQNTTKKKLAPLAFKVDRKQTMNKTNSYNSLPSPVSKALQGGFSKHLTKTALKPIVNNTLELKQQKQEQEALTQLISARARKQEIMNFITLCSRSLHKGPWSRVSRRPLPLLVEACMEQISSNKHFRHNPELLQLACELAAQPETYEVITEILREKNGDGSEVDVPYHLEDGSRARGQSPDGTVELDPIQHQLRDIADNQGRLHREQQLDEESQNSDTEEVVLDSDLLDYLHSQRENQQLRTMGFFQKDHFLDFK